MNNKFRNEDGSWTFSSDDDFDEFWDSLTEEEKLNFQWRTTPIIFKKEDLVEKKIVPGHKKWVRGAKIIDKWVIENIDTSHHEYLAAYIPVLKKLESILSKDEVKKNMEYILETDFSNEQI